MRKQIGCICYGMSKKLYRSANALIFYNGLPASPFATGIVFEVEGDGHEGYLLPKAKYYNTI